MRGICAKLEVMGSVPVMESIAGESIDPRAPLLSAFAAVATPQSSRGQRLCGEVQRWISAIS
jgi:hypothetical protein